MATINDYAIVSAIIQNNGYFGGDERVVRIVEYNNAFNGAACYGLEYEGELGKYQPSNFILKPRVLWQAIDGPNQPKPGCKSGYHLSTCRTVGCGGCEPLTRWGVER